MVWCLENYFFIPFPNQPGIYESTLFFSYSSFSTDQRFAKFPINDINYTSGDSMIFGFHGPPTPACQGPCGFNKGRSLVVK